MYKSISLGGLHAEHRAATKAPPVWSKGWWLLDAQHRPHHFLDPIFTRFKTESTLMIHGETLPRNFCQVVIKKTFLSF